MPYNLAELSRQGKFEFPSSYELDKMDLIDLRRKILKWCAKSQGAVSPCRSCKGCEAGIRAVAMVDGEEAPKASEPETTVVVKKEPEVIKPNKIVKEVPEMKKEKEREKPISQWYKDAIASGDAVKWCMDNLGLTIQKAKKRVYMYEYNRFGTRRTKQTEGPILKSDPGPELKVETATEAKIEDGDISLVSAMQMKMKILLEKQQEYKTQIDDLTDKYKKINDQIEAITMCIELLNDKVTV